jgi:uncharacterized protein (DUF1499 family)
VNPLPPDPGRPRVRRGALWAWLSLATGLLSAAALCGAGLLYRTELTSLGNAFLAVRWAVYGALAGALFALLALGLQFSSRGPRGAALAGLALLINLLVAGPPLRLYQQAQALPKIHDISTDTQDPPLFAALLSLRQGARNPVDYAAATAAQQQRGYPDIAPLRLDLPPALAFQRAERAARAMRWQVVDVAPSALRIEATDTTLLFGFKDDIVIRVRAQGAGSIVDVRSLSRIGGSDMGTNAKRVRAYLRELAAG